MGGGKLCALVNIIINLSILGIFKYYNFFTESFITAFRLINVDINICSLKVILPVGISFYTFQALSYTIDVYRKKIEPTRDIIAFFAFISFFPQLVAGPIERATNLLPQFLKSRQFNYHEAVDGTQQILWGLFKKMVIADNCADFVNQVWSNYSVHNSYTLIICAIFFAFQIYGDFSGYSDVAIGTAKLFGIKLMSNFNVPYFSRNVSEFWKRWHISLNTWFVDYVYIPLGGSRNGRYIHLRNIFIIFLLSGLWHGANWTFVAWGFYHACLFIPLTIFSNNGSRSLYLAQGQILPSLKEIASVLVTFVLVVIGWIIFRADTIYDFWNYLYSICHNWKIVSILTISKKTVFFITIMIAIEYLNRNRVHGLQFQLNSRLLQWSIYLLFALMVLTQSGNQVQFIYFQF